MASIIAEFCQNHNGDKSILRDMIWSAADAGADYAKIQTMFAAELTHRPRFDGGLIEGGEVRVIDRPFSAEYERLSGLEFPLSEYEWFIQECHEAGILPLTTAFTRAQIPILHGFGFEAIKVASYDCASGPMLHELSEAFSHLFVSTGATWNHEIERTASLLEGKSFSFLHCVTVYPTPLGQMNLARIEYLRRYTPRVGLSDHARAVDGLRAPAVALLLGAFVIEKHFTVLPLDQTKDGPVSLDHNQLSLLCRLAGSPTAEVAAWVSENVGDYRYMMGTASRCLSEQELLNRDYYRGRFASQTSQGPVFNWENRSIV